MILISVLYQNASTSWILEPSPQLEQLVFMNVYLLLEFSLKNKNGLYTIWTFLSHFWAICLTIGQKFGSYSAWRQEGSMLNLLESRAQRIFLCREGGFVGTWVYWIASRQVTSEIEIRTLTYVVESKDKWFLGGKLHNAKIRGHVKLRYFVWSSSNLEGEEGWKI